MLTKQLHWRTLQQQQQQQQQQPTTTTNGRCINNSQKGLLRVKMLEPRTANRAAKISRYQEKWLH